MNIFEIKDYKKKTEVIISKFNKIIFSKNLELKYLIKNYKPITIKKVFSNDICDYIINIAERTALKQSIDCPLNNQNGWLTTRHFNYPTTDLPVRDIPELKGLVKNLVYFNVFPHIEEQYKVDKRLLHVNDMFIVKYDIFGQNELKKHKDGSIISFSILLNSKSNFEGGGTIFYGENDEEILYQHTKGDLLIHPGIVFHAGKKITQGTRYILVGFIAYHDIETINNINLYKSIKNNSNNLYDFNVNNLNTKNINTFEINSKLITEIYELINKIGNIDSKYLSIKKKYNCLEKYVYDMFMYHMKRMNLENEIDNYYVEYWVRKYEIESKTPYINPLHIDKDEFLKEHQKIIVSPILSTVTYLSENESLTPTIIFNSDKETNLKKHLLNLKNGFSLSFSKKNKHISFNPNNYHAVCDLSAFDNHNNKGDRITLMFNIWKTKPSELKLNNFYKCENNSENKYLKNENLTEIIHTLDKLDIQIKSIEMYQLLNRVFSKTEIRKNFEIIKKYLPTDKEKFASIVNFDI